MSRFELYSPEGIRVDGRRFNELRQFQAQINTHPKAADGSSYVQQGNSKVLCLINGPVEQNSSSSGEGPILNVNIDLLPFAGVERKRRTRNDRRISELCITLQRCFLKTIVLKNYSRTIIDINLSVLALDGGLLSCCCNAITLALIDAGVALYDYVSSVTVGLYDTTPLLDLNTLEENDLSFVTMGIVGDSDKIGLLLLEDRLPLDKLESVLSIGIEGCHRIKELMDDVVRNFGIDYVEKQQL
ncbi:unnamed protein product [[Candida] boidinii]|uniref:Ribosomal RNA-processing protein 41 n=1 Tax=Candida boidinii TaxID=5477 RepID=A0A9W6WGT2_CANBO|nr:hypothetical protein B5S30_g4164 [[Candida] boidinii]OWB85943.1 hypothetical protein B5S33_g4619 [[Candida] boidinii]GME68747.1 unnamed protein product [[Candida] boidinii]GMG17565.1 unnamed protein product [[Candida] boidinii]